jgi:hypothetical protein
VLLDKIIGPDELLVEELVTPDNPLLDEVDSPDELLLEEVLLGSEEGPLTLVVAVAPPEPSVVVPPRLAVFVGDVDRFSPPPLAAGVALEPQAAPNHIAPAPSAVAQNARRPRPATGATNARGLRLPRVAFILDVLRSPYRFARSWARWPG